jgi:hypothetical protein
MLLQDKQGRLEVSLEMKILVSFFCFLMICQPGISQNEISGIIKDKSTQQGIPYASIGIAGTQLGTLTDENGNFKLAVQHLSDTLKISSIGYTNLSIVCNQLAKNAGNLFYLKPEVFDLKEVEVKARLLSYKTLGSANYSKNICTAFVGENANWRGEQAAIQANNIAGTTVYLESFGFYIIKNIYTDSLQFRIMLYEIDAKGYPGKTFLKKPILFKTNVKQGEVKIDLKEYYINTTGDFFISLECLEEKMEANKFCFAGSIKVPSFVKTSAFANWIRAKGGGGDFNIKVSYAK